MVNRTKRLVLAFFGVVWLSLLAILVLAPGVYDQTLRVPSANRLPIAVGFLLALTGFVLLLCWGVIRGWRWTFWLILVAFGVGGLVRVPASLLQLADVVPVTGPAWYVSLQAAIGVVQVLIAFLMLAGFRRSGVWGD